MEKIITKLIQENQVMIFTKDYCPFSTKTKAFLSSKFITFFHVDMDLIPDGAAM
jgi:glutaredoxin